MNKLLTALCLTVLTLPAQALAQTATKAGPIIHSGGAVYSVTPDIPSPHDIDYRVAFDVTQGSGTDQVSTSLNTVARFLNMHAQAGIPRDRIGAAVVIHGSAVTDVLHAQAYHERAHAENPNTKLIQELLDSGTRVIVCGQSAASRGVGAEDLMEGVEMALSAMTAFVMLQHEGYVVNPW